jgi:septal ring factor EnvC (AmiA/AmiB activator)
MTFDVSTLQLIFLILGYIVIVITAFLATKFDIKAVKKDLCEFKAIIKEIKDETKMLRETVAQIAVQNTRLDNQGTMLAATQQKQERLEQRIYDMQRGKGFIQKDIDGEYPK